MPEKKEQWTTVIKPKTKLLDFHFKEIKQYKDLIWLFTKRNIVTRYKQTILGPLWLFITPILSTLVSTFVFGTIAKIESGTVPYFLFYFVGFTAWSYFASCITTTSSTFTSNAAIFGKVYFPRITMPIATVISGLLSFAVQFAMMIGFMLYFYLSGAAIAPEWGMIWLLPLLVIEMAALGLGCGIVISSITTKYRDLAGVVGLGVDMWKYITPVIYGIATLSDNLKKLCMFNPMSPVIEAFRYVILGRGSGVLDVGYLLLSAVETLLILFVGILLFNKVEKNFMDTV